jgi:protein required for attachment to host cells
MTKIPHDGIVFVGDGRKALFLRNEGDEKYPNLKTERVFLDHNPPTHEQGTTWRSTILLAWWRPRSKRWCGSTM